VDTDRAFEVVVDLMTSRMKQFEHVLAEELPALLAELDAPGRTALEAYVGGLEDWMAGILHWHEGCHRYEDSALRYPAPPGGVSRLPSGLGTSAAHIARLLPMG
jgi:germacradienol/geosmin synthase